MIIYPPYIADTIPAFTTEKVKIPFVMNPAIDIKQVNYFQIKIINYIDSSLIGTVKTTKEDLQYDDKTKSGTITFWFSNCEINGEVIGENSVDKGQYYKFQLSFSDDTDLNTAQFYSFSTASLGRCIGTPEEAPELEIRGRQNHILSTDSLNIGSNSFSGYHRTTLLSEPVYNYRFYIYNTNTNETIEDTGWLLHNVDNDFYDKVGTIERRNSRHDFVLKRELDNWISYSIVYQTKTINGFESKIECLIIKQGELPIAFEGQVEVGQTAAARENGYVQINIKGRPIKGKFELQRTSNNKEWSTLTTFETTELSDMSIFSWKDWSVEQGVTYVYAIRQMANGQYSERLKSVPIQIEFDHMFLSDGERQLKIAYNPKVSSIKDTILESKMDTIGSKYPFFFRNETVRYKEFPISGLISYLTDDNELFLTNEELGLLDPNNEVRSNEFGYSTNEIFKTYQPRTTNLFGYNFNAERIFKLAVMDWLNNGQPKLFRSPAEGNYIVRTMNVSLSPNEQVGRMLHTFSSTAYEIMEHNVDNLQAHNMIKLKHIEDPEPGVVTTTYTFDKLIFINGECDLVQLINTTSEAQKIKANTITNIIWQSTKPDFEDYIIIDGKNYYNNVSGIFQTPNTIQYGNIKIKQPKITTPEDSIKYGSSITITYIPDLSSYYGEDSFETMVATSDDVLFTVPAGYYIRTSPSGDTTNGVLFIKPAGSQEITCVNIYKTYVMAVRKDEDYKLQTDDDNTDPYLLKFFTKNYVDNSDEQPVSTIDCSDGQIRYFDNIEADLFYEKGAGLTIDIYACVGGQREFNSSVLGAFILNHSRLGG